MSEQSEANKWKDLGNQELQAGNFEKAIEHYSIGINIDEQNHLLYSNRSAAYAKVNRWNESLADATKCVLLDPKFVKVGFCQMFNVYCWLLRQGYLRKAVALQSLGKYTEAKTAYTQGLAIEPANAQMQSGYAECVKKEEEKKKEKEEEKKPEVTLPTPRDEKSEKSEKSDKSESSEKEKQAQNSKKSSRQKSPRAEKSEPEKSADTSPDSGRVKTTEQKPDETNDSPRALPKESSKDKDDKKDKNDIDLYKVLGVEKNSQCCGDKKGILQNGTWLASR